MTQRIEFRPFGREDVERLSAWLAEPHVARWWPTEDRSPEALAAEYLLPPRPGSDPDPSRAFLALEDGGTPFGFCQTYLHSDEPAWDRTIGLPNVAGVDYLIGEAALCGRGLGTRLIGAFCALVFGLYPEIDGIASVPQAANTASRKVLERNGFQLVDVRMVESDDPGDAGPAAIYLRPRDRRTEA